jgi:hypothetical protein
MSRSGENFTEELDRAVARLVRGEDDYKTFIRNLEELGEKQELAAYQAEAAYYGKSGASNDQ